MTSERLTYAEIERLAYRMFEFGKSGNTASAQCEMQALRIRMGWTGPGASIEPPSAPSAAGDSSRERLARLMFEQFASDRPDAIDSALCGIPWDQVPEGNRAIYLRAAQRVLALERYVIEGEGEGTPVGLLRQLVR